MSTSPALSTPPPDDSRAFDRAATVRLEIIRSLGRLRRAARTIVRSRTDAEDLVQATCLRALERSRCLRHDANVLSWMVRIMRNLDVDQRRRRTERATLPGDAEEIASVASEPIALWRVVDESSVTRHVPTLSPEFGSVWKLAHVDHLPQDQIATRLGIAQNTVASRMYRARAILRARLLEEYGSAVAD